MKYIIRIGDDVHSVWDSETSALKQQEVLVDIGNQDVTIEYFDAVKDYSTALNIDERVAVIAKYLGLNY